MTIPKLQRIKVATGEELRTWLRKNAGHRQEVMIVTCDRTSPDKHVSSARVRAAVQGSGWEAGSSYTLTGNLLGHVIRPG